MQSSTGVKSIVQATIYVVFLNPILKKVINNTLCELNSVASNK